MRFTAPQRMSCVSAAMATTALAMVYATPAFAQDDAAGSTTESEIIVTAQRRAERLEDVPISVTALSGDDLAKANVVSFRDIETVSPGTRVSSTGVFTQPAIRGITSTAIGPGIENNVAFYVDGFYQPDNAALGSDFANVTSVQVLKGPQGTLYGRNALGGAILVSTREPTDAEAVEFDADATYGSRNDVRLRAYVGARVVEGVSIGLGAYFRHNDGYLRRIDAAATQPVINTPVPNYVTPNTGSRNAAPFENSEFRLKLKLEPTSNLTVVVGYNNLYKFNPVAIGYGIAENNFYAAPLGVPGVTPGSALPVSGPLITNPDQSTNNLNPDFHTKQQDGTLKVVWDLGFGTLSSYTSYSDLQPLFDSDYDGTLVNYLRIRSDFDRKTFIENFDFNAQLTPSLTLIVGGLYYDDKSSSATSSFVLGNLVSQTSSLQKSKAYAVFGEATWEASPGLFLTGGLRYSYEKKRLSGLLAPSAAFPTGEPIPDGTVASFDDITPRATIRYEISQNTNVYASYSQGFKSGFFNSIGQTRVAATTPVKPEEVTAYELGFKTVQGGLRFEAAGYYYDYKNLQVSQLLNETCDITQPSCSPRVGVFVTNAAKAEIYGAEASVHAKPIDNLNLRLGVAYTHARYKEFDSSALYICGGRNVDRYAASCPAAVLAGQTVGAPIVQDLSGNRIQRSPDWTISFGGDYTIPVGDDGSVVLAGNAFYTSKYAPTSETYDPVTGDPRFYQKGYVTASGSITLNVPGDTFWVRGFVENATNKRFKIVDTASGRGDYTVLSEPRRFGVTLGYRY